MPLSEEEVRLAETSSKTLQGILRGHGAGDEDAAGRPAPLRMRVERGDGQEADLVLPEAALPLLLSVLREMGNGKEVAVVATDAEVTTQQAADFLNVSRPYVVKLLEEGKIPFRSVGPRRRVLLEDLLAYKAREEAERHRGLDALVAEAQALGMY
jgi:DNA binding domain, excisionase family